MEGLGFMIISTQLGITLHLASLETRISEKRKHNLLDEKYHPEIHTSSQCHIGKIEIGAVRATGK